MIASWREGHFGRSGESRPAQLYSRGGVLLRANVSWPGSHVIDLTNIIGQDIVWTAAETYVSWAGMVNPTRLFTICFHVMDCDIITIRRTLG